MDKMQLVLQAIDDLEQALETAKEAVSQSNIGLARPAAYFADCAVSLLIFATEDEESN